MGLGFRGVGTLPSCNDIAEGLSQNFKESSRKNSKLPNPKRPKPRCPKKQKARKSEAPSHLKLLPKERARVDFGLMRETSAAVGFRARGLGFTAI